MVSHFSYENEGCVVRATGNDSHAGFHKLARNFSMSSRAAWLLTWIQESPTEGQHKRVKIKASAHRLKQDHLISEVARTFFPLNFSLSSKGFILMCMCSGGERYLITAEQVTYKSSAHLSGSTLNLCWQEKSIHCN